MASMVESENELQAENLFLKGAELERSNNHYEAIKYYRKAFQLVPDIDLKVYRKINTKVEASEELKDIDTYNDTERYHESYEDEYVDENETLVEKFQRQINMSGIRFFPRVTTKDRNLLDLPHEVVLYIFRWVISDELDLRSFDRSALVCKSFYLCSRDSTIWRSACIRTWMNKKLELENYPSWRDMFLYHPRISTDGCYIAQTKYYRQGEKSFQDETYKPYHLVTYYRYLRFFADGTVLMVNSTDTPIHVVGQLKNKKCKFGPAMIGSYKITDNCIHSIFTVNKIIKNNDSKNKKLYFSRNVYEMTFRIERFQKWYSKLIWKEYKLTSSEPCINENFQLSENRFPPLKYSRVRSYTAEAERPLP